MAFDVQSSLNPWSPDVAVAWVSCVDGDRVVGWERCPGLAPEGQTKLVYQISLFTTEIFFFCNWLLY